MYLHKINQHAPFRHKLIWKLKIPLKDKDLFLFLQRGVILTKNNLARKNWNRSLKCCFCNCDESITPLLFDCHYSKEIWKIVYLATELTPPRSISHMLGIWLSNFNNNERRVVLVGEVALCWVIWRYRSDIIFNKTKYSSFIHAIFSGTYWLRLWVHLQHEDMTKVLFRRTSLALETVALEIANPGWKHNLRIGLDHFSLIFSPNSIMDGFVL